MLLLIIRFLPMLILLRLHYILYAADAYAYATDVIRHYDAADLLPPFSAKTFTLLLRQRRCITLSFYKAIT